MNDRDVFSRHVADAFRVCRTFIWVAGLALVAASASSGSAAAVECRSDPQPGIDWNNCKKRMLMLGGSSFEGGNLSGADFSLTDLSNTVLKNANLNKTTLVRASLANADAAGANFERVEGYRSNLSGISAVGANFVSSEMQRSNFAEADLSRVDFTKAELGRTSFVKAKLDATRFAMANLSRANFHNAEILGSIDFTHAFLFLTRIEGVDLSSATGLTQEQITLACGDDRTKLPQGLQKPEQWPCEEE